MKTISKISLVLLLLFGLLVAPAGAWKAGDLLRSDVLVRAPNMVYVYVTGAPKNVKSCEIHGIPAKVKAYKYDKTASLCSLSSSRDYRRVRAETRVEVKVTYINGRSRSEVGKVRWDGIKN